MAKKIIVIKRATKPNCWWQDYIGQEFTVDSEEDRWDNYYYLVSGPYSGAVYRCDCTVISPVKSLIWEELKGSKTAVRCKTQQEYDEVKAIIGSPLTSFHIFRVFRLDCSDAFKNLYQAKSMGYKVIEASIFIKANKATKVNVENILIPVKKEMHYMVGNYLSLDGEECQVRAFDYGLVEVVYINKPVCVSAKTEMSNCDFIPITDEWLLRLGFEATTENLGNLPCFKKGKYTIAKWGKDKWQMWIKTVDLEKSPQYVHQLQNLYLSLTGTRLNIKK